MHHTCTIVHKQYKPYILRIIHLINLFFFCEILCPERQNYLKILRFLFFFFALRKKHSGIKYFGKILEFARDCARRADVAPCATARAPRGQHPQEAEGDPKCGAGSVGRGRPRRVQPSQARDGSLDCGHPDPAQAGSQPKPSPPPARVTFRRVVVSLRGPGQSPVLAFARCAGSLRSDGRWHWDISGVQGTAVPCVGGGVMGG